MVLVQNLFWMSWNCLLALIPLLIAMRLRVIRWQPFRYLMLVVWLLFIPNAIYMYTDVIHIGEQWYRVGFMGQIGLMVEFMGLFTIAYFLHALAIDGLWQAIGLWSANKDSRWTFFLANRLPVDLGLHALIGFGVAMGRVMRTNSWYLISQPTRVWRDIYLVLVTPDLIQFAMIMMGVSLMSFGCWWLLRKAKGINWLGELQHLALAYAVYE